MGQKSSNFLKSNIDRPRFFLKNLIKHEKKSMPFFLNPLNKVLPIKIQAQFSLKSILFWAVKF